MNEWRYVFATATGTSHEKQQLPCQDYALCTVAKDHSNFPVLIATVSDGAGSAELSQIGSELACKILTEEIIKYLAGNTLSSVDRTIALSWLEIIRQAISKKAEETEKRPRDYACTLLAAIIGDQHNVFMQIGDGAMVVSEGGEADWGWIFWPQRGEFANTTFFLTDDSATERMEFDSGSTPIKEIALFTDGIESLVINYAAKEVHHPFFDKMFPSVRSSHAGFNQKLSESLGLYLMSPTVCERTDDDKSLILATKNLVQL